MHKLSMLVRVTEMQIGVLYCSMIVYGDCKHPKWAKEMDQLRVQMTLQYRGDIDSINFDFLVPSVPPWCIYIPGLMNSRKCWLVHGHVGENRGFILVTLYWLLCTDTCPHILVATTLSVQGYHDAKLLRWLVSVQSNAPPYFRQGSWCHRWGVPCEWTAMLFDEGGD